jgi:hypothetical protein
MKAEYFESANNVLHTFSPISRWLSKYFPKDWFVIKCKECKKIPTEVVSSFDNVNLKSSYHCLDCSPKK